MEAQDYKAALNGIRSKLEKRRGYATRVVAELFPKATTPRERNKRMRDVYNVAHARVKNPDILKALIKEAEAAETHSDPSLEIISDYLKTVAA